MTTERGSEKPTISELEVLINKTEDGEVEILPNGEVVRLTPHELAEKNLRKAKETMELLRSEATKLRDRLKRILEDLEGLLP